MKTPVTPSAGEVFTLRQYKDSTLTLLHRDLAANRESRRHGTWEYNQLAACKMEMKRRGLNAGVLAHADEKTL